jgi:hypothetical protein
MNAKKILLGTLVVFLAWAAMDFVIHGVILQAQYASSPTLFRPRNEMKMVLMYFTVLVSALMFVYIYGRFFALKCLRTGFTYGLCWGLAYGMGMGYGTYSSMPIPYFLALGWFLGTVVEMIVAGLLVGAMLKD